VVKDVPESHLCCGSAGTYNILQPELAGRLRDRKVANIASVEPDVIAAGNIGCMVNGAGLAMATMDVIKLAGSEPANFLDVGGGATKDTVAAGFRILLKDPNVKGIFINIFGGIVRCERIAHGVIEAAKEVKITVPLVVRLQGTNADEGRKLLADSGLKLEVANDLWEAAQKIVKLTGKAA
jgi:succinyl-CoA synthetase beta subunit